MPERRLTVDVPGARYDVRISSQGFDGLGRALGDLGLRDCVLVTDEAVGQLWAEAVCEALGGAPEVIPVPAGEAAKTPEVWLQLVERLLAVPVHRRTAVLALGGGAVGDLAGFAAACTLRGLPLVQLPTTLLAMVDSSVGGKTAVNATRGKNLIGAFHQPSLVWAALPTLETLPDEEWTSGLGEVLKTALVGDAALFEQLSRDVDPGEVVARCVAVKARIVAEDEREGGVRALLNAGHTVGHALETALGHGRLRHGHAVAIGLVAEAAYAVAAGVCEQPELPARIASRARALGLPVEMPEGVDDGALIEAVRLDKKGSTDRLRLPLPVRAGVYTFVPMAWDDVPDLWKTTFP